MSLMKESHYQLQVTHMYARILALNIRLGWKWMPQFTCGDECYRMNYFFTIQYWFTPLYFVIIYILA